MRKEDKTERKGDMTVREGDRAGVSRRKFVSSIGALGAVAAFPFKSFSGSDKSDSDDKSPGIDKSIKENEAMLKAGPYLQAPSANCMTVRWITRLPCYSWVEYGESGDKLDKKAAAGKFGLVEAFNTVNAIVINDLQPGRMYFYRICSKKIAVFEPYKMVFGETFASEVYSFATANPRANTASFLVFNDIHDRPESFPLLLQYNGDRKNDFVFLNGDMFNFQTDEDQLVNHLLQPFGQLFASTPFFFSRGNHEARGKFARYLPEYFNGEDPMFYFSFQYGPMYAIVLDSGEDKEDSHAEYDGLADFDNYRLQQAAWLEKEIQKPAFKKARHKIVFSHIPLYYAGDWHGTKHCREVWGPILNKGKIDLLISGHTHKYGIYPKVKGEHDYPIVIGGGPQDTRRTIIRVEADREAFKLEMLDDQGKVVGTIAV